jgi:hypothetical protein
MGVGIPSQSEAAGNQRAFGDVDERDGEKVFRDVLLDVQADGEDTFAPVGVGNGGENAGKERGAAASRK